MWASKIPFTRKIKNFMAKPCAEVQTVTVKEICLTRRDKEHVFFRLQNTDLKYLNYSFKSGSYPYVCVHMILRNIKIYYINILPVFLGFCLFLCPQKSQQSLMPRCFLMYLKQGEPNHFLAHARQELTSF